MKKLLLAMFLGQLVLNLSAGQVRADDTSCKARAADKKLAGAAQTSFMKKCHADATQACDARAADKKLAGAAKTSFTKKCVADAVGP
jgi:hypothetical protein